LEPQLPDRHESDFILIVRYTRNWLHYGWMGFTFLLCTVAAVQGLMAG